MTYNIFDNTKTITIPNELVNIYEKHVAPFSENRAEYLALSGGCSTNSTVADIENAIIEGIHDETNTFSHLTNITTHAILKGLVK